MSSEHKKISWTSGREKAGVESRRAIIFLNIGAGGQVFPVWKPALNEAWFSEHGRGYSTWGSVRNVPSFLGTGLRWTGVCFKRTATQGGDHSHNLKRKIREPTDSTVLEWCLGILKFSRFFWSETFVENHSCGRVWEARIVEYRHFLVWPPNPEPQMKI